MTVLAGLPVYGALIKKHLRVRAGGQDTHLTYNELYLSGRGRTLGKTGVEKTAGVKSSRFASIYCS